jgi:hypothetical protein
MPKRDLPAVQASYYLLSVDSDAREVPDPQLPGGKTSDSVINAVKASAATDVFIWSHGWKGDVAGAYEQYDKWVGAFAGLPADREAMREVRPEFKELHVGFHWPSLSWADETPVSGDSFAAGGAGVQAMLGKYAQALGDSPAVNAALTQLFDELRTNAAAFDLTPRMREAYMALNDALALGTDGVPGEGASDREPFDPDQAVEDAPDEVSFGSGGLSSLLSPLRQLTFWTMKKRANQVGENYLHGFVSRLMTACPGVRVHLMGHSFGCIVMSSALGGRGAIAPLPRPVASCVLVQGAMSLWAYASSIPMKDNVSGYFAKVLADRKVSGPIATTMSMHDYAVGKLYPWAAGIAGQVAFDQKDLPKFGAIGSFGICGADASMEPMRPASESYGFKSGRIYNVDGSKYIAKLDGASGAHSDISGSEVAHLIWQAALPE